MFEISKQGSVTFLEYREIVDKIPKNVDKMLVKLLTKCQIMLRQNVGHVPNMAGKKIEQIICYIRKFKGKLFFINSKIKEKRYYKRRIKVLTIQKDNVSIIYVQVPHSYIPRLISNPSLF